MGFAGSLRKVLLSIICGVVVALVLAFTLCMYQREKKTQLSIKNRWGTERKRENVMMGIFFYVVLEKYIKINEVRYGVCLSKQRIRDLGFVSVSVCVCARLYLIRQERERGDRIRIAQLCVLDFIFLLFFSLFLYTIIFIALMAIHKCALYFCVFLFRVCDLQSFIFIFL